MLDANKFVDETSELRPISLYAETKVAVEKEILARQDDSPTCYTCLRFATVYGVSPRMRFDLTVNQFAIEMVVKKKLLVYGEQFWRPYIHVRDMAKAVGDVLCAPIGKVRGEVFNVGSTEENYTKQMIVEIIREEASGGEVQMVHKDEDPRDYRVSFDKIREQLGFKPSRKLRDGVREVVQLMRSGIIQNPEDGVYSN
jgi:nucleoside-diphosphate-sugar epimerase